MKYCPKCGVQCEDDQLFCAKCGTPLPVNVNIENTAPKATKAEPEVVAEPVAEVAEPVAEVVVADAEVVEEKEEKSADTEKGESTVEAPKVVEAVFNAEPTPEGKLNVGMLVWSIINLICCVVPAFGVVSLIMTILAKNSDPEGAKKKIKLATIFNLIGSIGSVLFYIFYFILILIGILGSLA